MRTRHLLFDMATKNKSFFFIGPTISAAVLFLSGCSFAPKYEIPNIVNNTNNSWSSNPWTQAQPSDQLDKGQWWRVFRDEALNDLESTLIKQSPSLAIALARYDQASAYLKQAQSAELPSIDASESTTQNRQSLNRPLRGSNQPNYYNAYTDMLSTNYELDFWGRVRNLVNAAQAQAQGSAADLQTERLSLQSKVAELYFELRGVDKQIAMLDDAVQAYMRAYDLIANRYDVGVASGIDMARAQTQLSTIQAEASELRIQRVVFEHAIAVLLGEVPQTFRIKPLNTEPRNINAFLTPDSGPNSTATRSSQSFAAMTATALINPSNTPEVPVNLPSTLLERRPDVAAAERKMAAANKRIGVAKAAFYPSFSIGASAGYQNTGGPDWMSQPNSFWSIGPTGAFNFFDGGLREAQLIQAKAALDQAAAEYRLAVLTAFQQVEDSVNKLREYKDEINNRANAANAALKAMQLATSRYREGAVNYLEVVTAQTAALQAERSFIALDTIRQLTSIQLIKALGGGWNKESLKIE